MLGLLKYPALKNLTTEHYATVAAAAVCNGCSVALGEFSF